MDCFEFMAVSSTRNMVNKTEANRLVVLTVPVNASREGHMSDVCIAGNRWLEKHHRTVQYAIQFMLMVAHPKE